MAKARQIILLLLTLVFTHQSLGAAFSSCNAMMDNTTTTGTMLSSDHEMNGHDMDAMDPAEGGVDCCDSDNQCSTDSCLNGGATLSSNYISLFPTYSSHPNSQGFAALSLAAAPLYYPPIRL